MTDVACSTCGYHQCSCQHEELHSADPLWSAPNVADQLKAISDLVANAARARGEFLASFAGQISIVPSKDIKTPILFVSEADYAEMRRVLDAQAETCKRCQNPRGNESNCCDEHMPQLR